MNATLLGTLIGLGAGLVFATTLFPCTGEAAIAAEERGASLERRRM